jgi:hypothetical protein
VVRFLGLFFDFLFEFWIAEFFFPGRDVFHPRAFGDFLEEGRGDVVRVLLALVAVEEFDEAPAAALSAGGQSGDGRLDRIWPDDHEVAIFELGFAGGDLAVDQRGADFFGRRLLDRAL